MTARTSTEDTTPATVEAAPAPAPVESHDRATTPVGAGRIRFKGHQAEAGYPFRVWDGRVQAFVKDAWVDAPDSEVI